MPETEFTFALVVAGLDVDDDAAMDAFFAGGLDDATVEDRDGTAIVTLFRRAASADAALRSALADVPRAVPGARVLRVDDQLVGLADIADLIGRTAEGVRLIATAARGPGGFPVPAGVVGRGVRLWRWPDVRPWLVEHGFADDDDVAATLPTPLIDATNVELAARATAGGAAAA